MNSSPHVTIVMPLYNCELYVAEAIDSVIAQTYTNWDLIIVDDCSTDRSAEIVKEYECKFENIRLVSCAANGGAANARNVGLDYVTGQFLAFFDADDVWLPTKLEQQIAFMRSLPSYMCFTSYETIESNGEHRNYVHVPVCLGYKEFLKNTVTCSHTIMFNLDKVRIDWLRVTTGGRDYDFPEDMDAWCSVLKHDVVSNGLDEVLAKNRKHGKSRSSNKLHAVQRTWNQYRKNEDMSVVSSLYYLSWQLFHAVLKRI